MEKLNKATILALEAHKEQKRKNGSLIYSSFWSGRKSSNNDQRWNVLVRPCWRNCWRYQCKQFNNRKEFGSKVASLVASETEDKG